MKRSLVDQRGCDFVEKRSICLYVYQFCMLFVVYRGNAKNRVSHFIGCVFIQVDVSSGSASFLPKMTGWSTVSRISAVENKSLWTQQSYSQPNTHLQKVDNATICTCTQKYENSILSSLSNICFGLWDPLESHSSDTQNPPHGCRSGRSVNGGMWMWVVKWVRFRMVRCGAW